MAVWLPCMLMIKCASRFISRSLWENWLRSTVAKHTCTCKIIFQSYIILSFEIILIHVVSSFKHTLYNILNWTWQGVFDLGKGYERPHSDRNFYVFPFAGHGELTPPSTPTQLEIKINSVQILTKFKCGIYNKVDLDNYITMFIYLVLSLKVTSLKLKFLPCIYPSYH
jgi:hypothetical protein